jgi:DNA-directed RNA polymerase subunit K
MMAKSVKDEDFKYTKYEQARIVGSRALQIAMGAPFLIKISDEEMSAMRFNPVEIAKREFKENVIPITVKRPLPKSSLDRKKD